MKTKNNIIKGKILEKIISIIIENSNPDKIILFGSRAVNAEKKDSDYDLVIIKKNIKNERMITRKIYRAFFDNNINVPVDLIAIDFEKFKKNKSNKNMIYMQIDKEGIILYE